MAWEKVKVFTIASVDTQASELLQPIGGRSIAGTQTSVPNALIDSMVWDSAVIGLSTTIYDAAGGSGTVELLTTIDGITFPICRSAPLAAGRTVMNNLMNSPWIPLPTHVSWDETIATLGITASVVALAKTARGQLKGAGNNSKKVVIGKLIATIGDIGVTAGSGNGVTNSDRVIALSPNPAASLYSRQNASMAGSQQFDLWDAGGYFMQVTGCSGSYTVRIHTAIDGQSYTTAIFPAVTGVTRVVATNVCYGTMPRPTHIAFDAPSGAAVGLTAAIYFVGKGTRGQRFGS